MIDTVKKLREMNYPIGPNIKVNLPIINNMYRYIKEKFPEGTITIWCRGSSGAIIAGIISSKLKGRARIAYISKPNEKRHDPVSPYQYLGGYNIIVDDFICTGKTIDDIIKKSDCKKFDLLIVSGIVSEKFIKSKSWNNIFETICCQKS